MIGIAILWLETVGFLFTFHRMQEDDFIALYGRTVL